MPSDGMQIGGEVVPLHDDSMGVMLESTPRKIQEKRNREYLCSVNPEWLEKLGLAEQGEPTVHSFSLGVYPVVVQNPAIIIQSAEVIDDG